MREKKERGMREGENGKGKEREIYLPSKGNIPSL